MPGMAARAGCARRSVHGANVKRGGAAPSGASPRCKPRVKPAGGPDAARAHPRAAGLARTGTPQDTPVYAQSVAVS